MTGINLNTIPAIGMPAVFDLFPVSDCSLFTLPTSSKRLTEVNLNSAVQPGFHCENQGTELFCGIPREAGGGPSAMRARPDEVYASRRAPAMRAENFNRSFQVKNPVNQSKTFTCEHSLF